MASDKFDPPHNLLLPLANNSTYSRARNWILNELRYLAELAARGDNNAGKRTFRQMLYLESPPGYGKTSFVHSIARELNETHPVLKGRIEFLETVLAAHTNSSDIMGTSFPAPLNAQPARKVIDRVPGRGIINIGQPALLPRHVVQTWTPLLRQIEKICDEGKFFIWFFDEVNNINSRWEVDILKLFEGQLKGRILPPNFVLVGAGNPPEQSIHKSGFGESFNARLYRIPFIPDYDVWRSYMLDSEQSFERLAMRRLIVDFVGSNRQYLIESVQRAPHQMGYVATNPRNWTLTADQLARLYRHNDYKPSSEEIRWVVERRIPASVAKEVTDFITDHKNPLISSDLRSRSAVVVPASYSPSHAVEQLRLPALSVPTPVAGNGQDEDWEKYKSVNQIIQDLEKSIQTCVQKNFAKDVREHELIHNNILSYILDSLEETSSFRPIPYLVGDPGLGKTSFVSQIINDANLFVAEKRKEMEADYPDGVPHQVKERLREFVLLEIVLASVPQVTDLTGIVFPAKLTDDKPENQPGNQVEGQGEEQNKFQLEPVEGSDGKHFRFRIQSPGDDGLPRRHAVNAWTWFTDKLYEIVRSGKQAVVFFDEFSNISSEWEAVSLKIVEGKIGTWKVPSSVIFLTAGNFAHQSAFGRKFGEPMQARLEFMQYHSHFGKWANHMLRTDVSRNDYLARFAIVNFLLHNPELFQSSSRMSKNSDQFALPCRDWTLSARWMRRISDFMGRELTADELVWFLSPRLSQPIASKFAKYVTSSDVLERAGKIWDYVHNQKLSSVGDGDMGRIVRSNDRSGLDPKNLRFNPKIDLQELEDIRNRSSELQKKLARARQSMEDGRSKKAGFKDITQSTIESDIKHNFFTKATIKAYLLETPPPEGEFCDIIYLTSPPGYGKTSFVKGIIDELNRSEGQEKFKLIELNLSAYTISEIIGVPIPVNNNVDTGTSNGNTDSDVYSPGNENLPRRDVVNAWSAFTRQLDDCLAEGKTPVVFIDEMSNISQQWEAVLLKFVESKIDSSRKIQGPIRFIAAGNPPEDSRAGRHFGPPLNARLYKIPFRPSFLDYVKISQNASFDVYEEFASQAVVNYLALYPDQFVPPPNGINSQNRKLCPRNWTKAVEQYAGLIKNEVERMQIRTDEIKDMETLRTIPVNQQELQEMLEPLLPHEAASGFAAFAGLESFINGDEIILEGKSLPSNLTSEQIKVIVHSATVSLYRNINTIYSEFEKEREKRVRNVINNINTNTPHSVSEKKIPKWIEPENLPQQLQSDKYEIEYLKKLGKYVGNFMNFIHSVKQQVSCNQELDSLLMRDIKYIEKVFVIINNSDDQGSKDGRLYNFSVNDPEMMATFENLVKIKKQFYLLNAYLYNSLHQTTLQIDLPSNSSPNTQVSPKNTGTTPFLTNSSPSPLQQPRRIGNGIS